MKEIKTIITKFKRVSNYNVLSEKTNKQCLNKKGKNLNYNALIINKSQTIL